MNAFFFTPTSIGFLALLIYSVLIFIFLFRAARRTSDRHNPTASRFLTSAFGVLAVFLFLMFLEETILYRWNIVALYLQSFVFAIFQLLFLQFAYQFPFFEEKKHMESRLVLFFSSLYVSFEAWIAFDRFRYLLKGQVHYRPGYSDLPLVLGLIWLFVVFVRRTILESGKKKEGSWWVHLTAPQGRGPKATGAFARLLIFGLLLGVFEVFLAPLRDFEMLYRVGLFVGLLFLLSIFISTYINTFPEIINVRERLIAIAVASNLVVISIAALALQAPAQADRFYPEIDFSDRTLYFSRTASGGYEIKETEYQFEEDVGDPILELDETFVLPFEFPFYDETHSKFHLFNIGVIGFDERFSSINFQYNYGDAAMIAPMYYPAAEGCCHVGPYADTEVFYRTTDASAMITWQNLPEMIDPDSRHTFQLILYENGDFQINFKDVDPKAENIFAVSRKLNWYIGMTPGSQYGDPVVTDTFPLTPQLHAEKSPWMLGIHYAVRSKQSVIFAAFVPLLVFSSLAIFILIPKIMEENLISPLNRLISGAEKIQKGDYGVDMPPAFDDEIGQISKTFNQMVAHMREIEKDEQTPLEKLAHAFDQSPTSVMILNPAFNIDYVNQAFLQMTGFKKEAVLGEPANILKTGKTLPEVYLRMWRSILTGDVWRGELQQRRADDSEFWVYAAIAPIKNTDGKISHYVWMMEDFTERKEAEDHLIKLSTTDALTEIHNRRQLMVLLKEAFNRAARYDTPLSVLMFDIDDFKQINDTYGHLIGDLVLKELAALVGENIRAADIFGRYGGEEFMIGMPNTAQAGALVLAETLREKISNLPIPVNQDEIGFTVSIGVTEKQDEEESFQRLINKADQALYAAKRGGKNRVILYAGQDTIPDIR